MGFVMLLVLPMATSVRVHTARVDHFSAMKFELPLIGGVLQTTKHGKSILQRPLLPFTGQLGSVGANTNGRVSCATIVERIIVVSSTYKQAPKQDITPQVNRGCGSRLAIT